MPPGVGHTAWPGVVTEAVAAQPGPSPPGCVQNDAVQAARNGKSEGPTSSLLCCVRPLERFEVISASGAACVAAIQTYRQTNVNSHEVRIILRLSTYKDSIASGLNWLGLMWLSGVVHWRIITYLIFDKRISMQHSHGSF